MNVDLHQMVVALRKGHHVALGRRASKRKRIPQQHPPLMVQQAYASHLIALVDHLRSKTKSEILHELPTWVRESDRLHGRTDSAASDAASKFAGIRLSMKNGAFSSSALRSTTETIGSRTAANQKEQLQRQLSVAVGVKVPVLDKDLAGKVEAFTEENVALIQSIPEQALAQVQQTVLRGLTGGARADEIAKDIEDRFDVSESRAVLIATDQTLKFFSSLNETRQKALGITHFVWNGADDERECDICEPFNDKRFSWDDPPSEGLPGQIHPLCRCSADPDVEGLLDSL